MNLLHDYNSINGKVIISLSDSINTINNIANKCTQLVVPGDFQYAQFLNNLYGDFSQSSRNLSMIKEYLYRSNQEYEKLINDLSNQAKNINNIMIDSQESNIR